MLDEALKIPKRRRLVGSLLKLAVSLCTRLSYREASEVLEEAGFGYISHQRLHDIVKSMVKTRLSMLTM